jgi:hypothetical protein
MTRIRRAEVAEDNRVQAFQVRLGVLAPGSEVAAAVFARVPG